MEYYLENREKVLQELQSSERGLNSAEAAKRLQQNGKNRLKEEEKRPVVCPYCGATTTPDAKGCCEYCGAPLS